MNTIKTKLMLLLVFSLVVGQQSSKGLEHIQEWSTLLGKMRKNISQDMKKQENFDINVASLGREISQLDEKMNNTNDSFVKDELQAEIYSLDAELLIGKIIRLERKLELATVITDMLESLTHNLLSSNGGSAIKQKYEGVLEKQRLYKADLEKTSELLSDIMGYFRVSPNGVNYIDKYREATQRKIQKQKVKKSKSITYYAKQFQFLEEIELLVLEGYDPLEVELSILEIEMDLEILLLDAALHNIEVQGDFIAEMINVNSIR